MVDHVVNYYDPNMVPFDDYYVAVNAFVIEKETNKPVPIVAFGAGDGDDYFFLSSTEGQAKTNYTYDLGTGPTMMEVDSGMINITVKRSHLARAFTMCLLLINWALAIGSTYVTLAVVVRRERVHEGVLLLPITLVLTIPTLRGLYVGSPPFGIYFGRS